MRRRELISLLVAGGFSETNRTSAEKLPTIGIGIAVKGLIGLPLIVARDKAFFGDEGIAVTLDYFSGGPPALAALIGGSVQIINAALENNIKTVMRGQPIVTVANMLTTFNGALIIRDAVAGRIGHKVMLADMKGLRIGTTARGGATDVIIRYLLKGLGLDPDSDAQLMPMRSGEQLLAAGAAGEVDAAMITEPWPSVAIHQMHAWQSVIDFSLGEGPDLLRDTGYSTVQTTRGFVAGNRPLVEAVVRAVVRAQGTIGDLRNLDEVAAIAAKEFGTDPAVMRESVAKQALNYVPAMRADMIGKTFRLLADNGTIAGAAPPFDAVVDASFAPLWAAYRR